MDYEVGIPGSRSGPINICGLNKQLKSLDFVSKVKDVDEIISKVLSISSVLRVFTKP